jgi:hypothetical protein
MLLASPMAQLTCPLNDVMLCHFVTYFLINSWKLLFTLAESNLIEIAIYSCKLQPLQDKLMFVEK